MDLTLVSSVDSNLTKTSSPSASPHPSPPTSPSSLPTTPTTPSPGLNLPTTIKITIHAERQGSQAAPPPPPLLTLFPQSASQASEWLDGLLMLLNQAPVTPETQKLVRLIGEYGLKIRLLNVHFDDALYASESQQPDLPSREGLEGEEFWYDVFGA